MKKLVGIIIVIVVIVAICFVGYKLFFNKSLIDTQAVISEYTSTDGKNKLKLMDTEKMDSEKFKKNFYNVCLDHSEDNDYCDYQYDEYMDNFNNRHFAYLNNELIELTNNFATIDSSLLQEKTFNVDGVIVGKDTEEINYYIEFNNDTKNINVTFPGMNNDTLGDVEYEFGEDFEY